MAMFLCHFIVLISFGYVFTHSYTNETLFDRDLTSVHLSTCLFPEDNEISDADAYSEMDFIQMVKTISTQFSKITVEPRHQDIDIAHNYYRISIAVAKFNKYHRTLNERPVQVSLRVFPSNSAEIFNSNFDNFRKIADEVNLLFSGTIKTFLFNCLNIKQDLHENLIESIKYARNAITKDKKFTYKLELIFGNPQPLCLQNDFLDRILELTDGINFVLVTTPGQLRNGLKANYELITRRFSACKTSLYNKRKHLQVGFCTGITSTDGKENYSDLVRFWMMINKWAVKWKTPVTFFEAFNGCNITDPRRYSGWWSPSYGENGSLLEFKLEEKALVIQNQSHEETAFSKDFHRDHTSVTFFPWVNPDDEDERRKHPYDESSLLNMIEKISTRFSKVMLEATPPFEYVQENIGHLIPSAIATWNKFHRSSTSTPMEVRILCDINEVSRASQLTADTVMHQANKANKIYPETVKVILIKLDSHCDFEDFVNPLKIARDKLISNRASYKLGLYINIGCCGRSRYSFSKYFNIIMNQVDEVVFQRFSTKSEREAGIASSFPTTFKQFERCLPKMQRQHSRISTGFHTNWHDTIKEGQQNIPGLVEFWRRANHWAVAVNTNVILGEAFNNFYLRTAIGKTTGWWYLDQSRNYSNPSQYVFLEKADYLDTVPPSDQEGRLAEESTDFDVATILMICVVVILLLVITVTLPLAIVYRKRQSKLKRRLLSKEEVQEFFEGQANPTLENIQEFLNAPYNNDFELLKDSFTIDETNALGKGAFGAVFSATVHVPAGDLIKAAVKMTLPSGPTTALKGLLSEIKILTHVAQHENIVSIVGAYTSELSEGKVYIFLELCSNGSLKNYLLKIRSDIQKIQGSGQNQEESLDQSSTSTKMYKNIGNNSTPGVALKIPRRRVKIFEKNYTNCCYPVTPEITSDLHRWGFEIAQGMEFLVSKKVVHADLATRNVLLTENKRAKISDFGLSRKLYEYTNYIKKQQEPLPWRWMAPESLCLMEFGEKTDVWAFGITLWEIYSLGNEPYPGMSWTVDYAKKLKDGLRPGQTPYGNVEMHNLMEKCWEFGPENRPTFSELRDILQ